MLLASTLRLVAAGLFGAPWGNVNHIAASLLSVFIETIILKIN
jgi:hypothetical protein